MNGLRLLVPLGLTQILSWGSLYYAFALMIVPLARATGAGHGTVVGAFSFALLVNGVASAPVGRWIDRHGGRWAMCGGSLLGGALLIALAYVHGVVALYTLWGLIGVAMAASLYDPAFAVLGQIFQERQRKAITALTLFGGFASTVFWPLTQALMQHLGWQQALVALGLLNLLVCAPVHALLLPSRRRPEPQAAATPSPPSPAGHSLLRDPTFLGLCAAFTGNALVFSALSVHLLPLLQAKGLTASQAAWAGALVGPMQVAGRVLEYLFLSRWSPSRVGTLAIWLLPASLGLLAVIGTGLPGLAAFALLYGAGNGVMTIVRGAMPAELYGRRHYGAINGAMAAPVLLAKAIGPLAAVAVAAAAGPMALLLGLALLAAASALAFGLTVRRRPVSQPNATA
jgi:MFS family permease